MKVRDAVRVRWKDGLVLEPFLTSCGDHQDSLNNYCLLDLIYTLLGEGEVLEIVK